MLQVEDEQKHASIPTKGGADNAQTAQLEDTIFKVSGQLSTISRMQKYFRTRENRNFSTVKSTEQRIFNFSLVEVAMMVGMAALQVLVVRFFFQGARKGEFFEADTQDQIDNDVKVMFDFVTKLSSEKNTAPRRSILQYALALSTAFDYLLSPIASTNTVILTWQAVIAVL